MTRSAATMALALCAMAAACAKGEQAAAVGTGPYATQIATAIPQIERATGLKFKHPPKIEERSREEIRTYLGTQFAEANAAQEIAGTQSVYRLFGMIPDTLDLRQFLLRLLDEQIAGYYDPATKVLYIPKGTPSSQVETVVSHELVHALQDQYLNLDSIQKLRGEHDQQAAAQAVIEGQATWVQIKTSLGGANMGSQLPGLWDRFRQSIRDNLRTQPVIASAPPVIQETLIFPYLSGAEFMNDFDRRRPGKTPLTDMPQSTEQIIYPDLYFASPPDVPTHVELPAPHGATQVYSNNLGEFETRILLAEYLNDDADATRAAAGWDGDRYVLVRTPRGEGLAWLTVWDTPVDAAEFASAMGQAISKRFGDPASHAAANGATVFTTSRRVLSLWGGEVGGRSAVLYVDVPTGASTDLIDLSRVKLH